MKVGSQNTSVKSALNVSYVMCCILYVVFCQGCQRHGTVPVGSMPSIPGQSVYKKCHIFYS